MRRLFFISILSLIGIALAQSPSRTVRIDDDSDWWSPLRTGEERSQNPDPIQTPDATLTISGISLLDQNLSAAIKGKFGQTVEVERGDASTGRRQYCFVSSRSGRKVYLIFEFDEINSAFYLFSSDRGWNGRKYCEPSALVGEGAITGSGLRLGMRREAVERILGKPTFVRGNRIAYDREISRKSSQKELARARAEAPGMNERELQENYGTWDSSTYIEARFDDSKLIYLVVSHGETQ